MSLDDVFSHIKIAADYWLVTDEFSPIEGFLDPIEGYALLLLAQYGPGVGSIVEIGSFQGRSTAYLARGSERGGREKVVAVDHFKGSPEHQPGGAFASKAAAVDGLYETFLKNLKRAGVADRVHVVRSDSAGAAAGWSTPIRLLFIDGDHSYEESRRDYELWSPWLAPEGLVAFHDIKTFAGVTRYYEELTAGGSVSEVLSVGTLHIAAGTAAG